MGIGCPSQPFFEFLKDFFLFLMFCNPSLEYQLVRSILKAKGSGEFVIIPHLHRMYSKYLMLNFDTCFEKPTFFVNFEIDYLTKKNVSDYSSSFELKMTKFLLVSALEDFEY